MVRRSARGIAALLAIAAVAAGAVLSAGQAPPAQLVPGHTAIAGRVVESGTATGIAEAAVTLIGPALGAPNAVFSNGVAGGSRSIVTDGQGRFLFRDLPPGTYQLQAVASGFVPASYGDTRPVALRRTLDVTRSLELVESDRVVPVSISLWKRGGISGVVLDEAEEPLVGMPVTVLVRMADWGGISMQQATSTLTDDRGAYHVDITPGDYVIGVLAATTTVPTEAVDEFQDAVAQGGAEQAAYMSDMQLYGGLLPRGYGSRTGPFIVSQFGDRNNPVVPPLFTADGAPAFYATTFHPAAASAATATVVSVGSGEEKSGIDLHLRPTPMLRVSGRVAGPIGPVSGIALRLIPADPAVQRTSPASVVDPTQALSDSRGDFTFVGVVPGLYTIQSMKRAASAADTILWAAEPVTVGDSNVSDVRVTLQGGAKISGRLAVEGSGRVFEPAALPAVSISARPIPGTPANFQPIVAERFDATAHFTTRPLVPGPYEMVVNGLPAAWVVKSVTAGGADAIDVPFTLTEDGVNDMVVTITDQISGLAGTARDDAGRPAASAIVVVFPASKSLWRLPGLASRRVQTAALGRDGRYAFRSLPTGDYCVVAVDWPGADFSDPKVLTALMPTASRVTIARGESPSQDLRVVVIK